MIRQKFKLARCWQTSLLYLISLVIELLFQIARCGVALLKFAPNVFSIEKLDKQLTGRTSGTDSVNYLADGNYPTENLRDETDKELLFFCSSAGEYEQSLPIIHSLARLHDAKPLILFQSRSGIDYARKKGEKNPCALAPPDALWRWRRFTANRQITATIVIRHEWWPGFLYHFRTLGPLFLVDAAVPARHRFSRYRNFGRAWLAQFFTKIFTIDEESTKFFLETLSVEPTKVRLTGDTKFDRVLDRAQAAVLSADLRHKIEHHAQHRKIIVAGSIYQEDIELLVTTFKDHPELCRSWSVVAVPHHLDQLTVTSIQERIATLQDNFTVIAELGVLGELYSIADVAWIGGACHNKVHNVLEPAAYGAILACGMNFTNSREAIAMSELNLLFATQSPTQLAEWLTAQLSNDCDNLKNQTRSFVRERTGSAQKIAQIVAEHLSDIRN